ncbi:MAG TPA: acylphosphatase [Polyangia bacterium]
MKRIVAIVHGRVQGVGFRATTCDVARRLGLAGWVRNRPDDTVEVQAQGDEQGLQRLHEFLRRGPSLARVSNVDWFWEAPTDDLAAFEIR